MPMSQKFKDRLFPLLPKLAQEFDTPIHVYDEVGIQNTIDYLKECMTGVNGFKEFFAVKALPVPCVLRMFKAAGFGFDCSSISEVILARNADAKPEDIMFTSNNTTTEEFECAMSDGGCILNLDDISFLDHPFFKENGFPETICFRINPGPTRQDDSCIGIPEEAKYGIMLEQLEEAYVRARDLGVKYFGMHTMICSGDLDYQNMKTTVRMLISKSTELRARHGIDISFINMGGGIGIPYRPSEEEFDLETFGKWLRGMDSRYKVYVESGRYMAGPHGVLVNRAINRKDIYQTHVGVQTAMPGLMRPAMYDAHHEITVVANDGTPATNENMEVVNIVGPICENIDRLATQRLLPHIKIGETDGDFIICHDVGAHGAAMGFNYNGRTRPGAVILTKSGEFQLCTHPETVDDLLSRTIDL